MKKITHPIYKDYPEQPYISPDRDLESWEKAPEIFPYRLVEKNKCKGCRKEFFPDM